MGMNEARELLSSRTGPRALSIDGSVAGPSTQEILAALAYVPAGLGRELLEALWWPESGRRRREQLRQAVVAPSRARVQPPDARSCRRPH